MEKDELLQRMREENKGGDERQRQVEERCYSSAFYGVIVASCSYYFYASLFLPETDKTKNYIMFPMVIGSCIYQFIKYREYHKKRNLIAFIFFLIGGIAGTIWIFTGNYWLSFL